MKLITQYCKKGQTTMDPAYSCTLLSVPDCKAYPSPDPEPFLKLLMQIASRSGIKACFPCNCMLRGGKSSGSLLHATVFAACLKTIWGFDPGLLICEAWETSIWICNIALVGLRARAMNTNMLMLMLFTVL